MYEQQIRDTWRTPLGAGIPATARQALSEHIARTYDQHTVPETAHAAIVRQAWRIGYRDGAHQGIAEAGRLVGAMTGRLAPTTTATEAILQERAASLQDTQQRNRWSGQINGAVPPPGLPQQMMRAHTGSEPLAGVAAAAQAWRHGHAAGSADGGLIPHQWLAENLNSAERWWLNLALTPVYERHAAHHGITSPGVTIGGIPAALHLNPDGQGELVGQLPEKVTSKARQLYAQITADSAASPEASVPTGQKAARASFTDNPWSSNQIVHPGGDSAIPALKEADSRIGSIRRRS